MAHRLRAEVVKLVPRAARKPALDDAEILAAVRRGDPSAATALYHRSRPQIDRTLVRLLGRGDSEHEDLAQTSMIALVKSIGGFRGECSLDTWTDRVTARTAFRQLRRRSSERRMLDHEADGDQVPSSGAYGDTTRQVDARNVMARIRVHIDAMDRAKSWAVILHDVFGYDLREIAGVMECTVAAAQSRLSRGRIELQERMQRDAELASYLRAREERR